MVRAPCGRACYTDAPPAGLRCFPGALAHSRTSAHVVARPIPDGHDDHRVQVPYPAGHSCDRRFWIKSFHWGPPGPTRTLYRGVDSACGNHGHGRKTGGRVAWGTALSRNSPSNGANNSNRGQPQERGKGKWEIEIVMHTWLEPLWLYPEGLLTEY